MLLVALEDKALFNMLLVYAAKHRAFLLDHPEPKARIARWMQPVRDVLTKTVEGSPVDSSRFATLLLYSSYVERYGNEISSPLGKWYTVDWIAKSGVLHRAPLWMNCWFMHWLAYGDYMRQHEGFRLASTEYEPDLHPHDLDGLSGLISKKIREVSCNPSRPDSYGPYEMNSGYEGLMPNSSEDASSLFVQIIQIGKIYGARLLMEKNPDNETAMEELYGVCERLLTEFEHWSVDPLPLHQINTVKSMALRLFVQGLFPRFVAEQAYFRMQHKLMGKLRFRIEEQGSAIFPLFILAASTKEPDMKEFVTEALDKLEKRGLLQVSKMLETSSQ